MRADRRSGRQRLAAVALGRRGGLKGGTAQAAKLTSEQREEIARNAVAKRWVGKPKLSS
jgi:hypothetical protein